MSTPPAPRGVRRWGGAAGAATVVVEIVTAVAVAHATSWGLTILLLVLLSLAGTTLLPRQAIAGWRAVRRATREGRTLDTPLADAVVRVIGTLLLVVPGFVTAALGILCLAPLSRPLVRRALMPALARRVAAVPVGRRRSTPAERPDGSVIDGEVEG